MKDNAVPEEKLLRLIRGTHKRESKAETKAAALPSEARVTTGQSLWQLIQNNLSFARSYKLQKILLTAFIISCALFAWSLLYPVFYSANFTMPQTADESAGAENPLPAPARPLEYYSNAVKSHQIFNSTQQGIVQPMASLAGVELSKDINLEGILMGPKPEAAIEDKKANKVFYVSQGMFIGDYQVDEIQEGKVIVSRNGQRFELHL